MARQTQVRWIFAAAAVGLALVYGARADRLPVKVFTSADGLGSSFVDYLMRDSRGFLWLCTRDGLSRFDGSRFVTYQIGEKNAAPGIESIFETRNGDYWITTTGGLFRFRSGTVALPGATGNNGRPVLPAELVSEGRGVLTQDQDGQIWYGSGGLFLVRDENGKTVMHEVPLHIPPAKVPFVIADIQPAPDHCIWMNTTVGLVRRLPDGRVILYRHEKVEFQLSTTMLVDTNGRIWSGRQLNLDIIHPETIDSLAGAGDLSLRTIPTAPSIVARTDQPIPLPEKPGETLNLTGGDFLAVRSTQMLFQSHDQHVWLTTDRKLLEYDGKMFHGYTVAQGLLPIMTRMAEDDAGNMWIASQTGLVRLDRRSLRTYTETDGLNSINVQAITESREGTLYVGTLDYYLSRFEGTAFSTVHPILPNAATALWTSRYALFDSRGDCWVLSSAGLFRFPGSDFSRPAVTYTVADGLRSNHLFQIFEDGQANIWVSERPSEPENVGLSRLTPGATRFYTFSAAEGYPPGKAASSFAQDADGNLWLGFYDGGLARFAGGQFMVFGDDDGVPKGVITDLHVDRAGRLWLASSNGGVGRVDDVRAKQPRIARLTINDGLSSNNIRTITEDHLGNIYLGTVRGVDRLSSDGLRVKHYSVSDGLAGDFVTSSHCDHDGVVWFGTTGGVSRLVPSVDDAHGPPSIWLGGLSIAGTAQPVSELGQTAIAKLELGHTQNTLQVDFFGIDFRSGETLRYQYKLEGSGGDWSIPAEQRSVTLANLQPGSYRFLVRAVDADGEVSPEPAAIIFRILPPVWFRWWFLALCALAVAAVITGFYRYRIARLREVNAALQAANRAAESLRLAKEERLAELERVRYRIATDLHDDIGASLTQIAILSEVAQQQNTRGNGAVAEPLEMIYNVSNELVGTMSDIVWAINPRKDHLPDLIQRMRRFASDVLAAKEIDFEFKAPPHDANLSLGANIRREVFLIFKEAVNNIVKHSRASLVEIVFEVADGELRLRLSDNGVGFVVPSAESASGANLYADSTGGNGLLSMRRRAADLGGEYSLRSEPGQGTVVSAVLPVQVAAAEPATTQLGSDGKRKTP